MSDVSREVLVSSLHAIVSSIAGADMALDAPLSQAGLDSLASVELQNELSRQDALKSIFCGSVVPGPVLTYDSFP